MKIYVASSWRNLIYPRIVTILREDGHDVYDFKNPEGPGTGFSWSEVPHDENSDWRNWTIREYLDALKAPSAVAGYERDMKALRESDLCVLVLPCGKSAHLELGWAAGACKKTFVYMPENQEAELMYNMVDKIVTTEKELGTAVHEWDTERRRPYAQAGDYLRNGMRAK